MIFIFKKYLDKGLFMLRIKIILCVLLLATCCSNNSEKKVYRTAIHPSGLQLFTDVISYQDKIILEIPFKSKVELVDNKKYYIPDDKIVSSEYSKVNYKGTIGFVMSNGLSERDDVPFIDNIKYDLNKDEFDYDKINVAKAFKAFLLNPELYKDIIFYYYTDNFQMFSLYGKDCDGVEIKIIAIILNSKIAPYFSRMICFEVKNNKFIYYYDFPVEVEDKIEIKENTKYIKDPTDCCN